MIKTELDALRRFFNTSYKEEDIGIFFQRNDDYDILYSSLKELDFYRIFLKDIFPKLVEKYNISLDCFLEENLVGEKETLKNTIKECFVLQVKKDVFYITREEYEFWKKVLEKCQ